MKRLLSIRLFFVALLLVVTEDVAAQTVQSFIEEAEKDFQRLSLMMDGSRKSYWVERRSKLVWDIAEIQDRQQIVNRSLEAEGYDIASLSFSGSSEVYKLKLDVLTSVVDSMGKEVWEFKLKGGVDSLGGIIDKKLRAMSGSQILSSVEKLVENHYQIKSAVEKLKYSPTVKTTFDYAPRQNAYDDNPELIGVYVLHDWFSMTDSLRVYELRLIDLNNSIDAKKIITPQDPLPYLPPLIQLVTLLTVIASLVVRFTKNPSSKLTIRFIVSLVISSMIASIVLIFVNPNTLLNLLIQSIIPGGFIIYWATWIKNKAEKASEKT